MRLRLYAAGVIGAIALLAIVLVVVLAFGRHHPSPPLLSERPRPEIPGEILYLDREGCFVVTKASGESIQKLGCSALYQKGPFGEEFWWIDENTVRWVLRDSPTTGKVMEVNIRTGVVRETGQTAPATSPEIEKGLTRPPVRGVLDCLQAPDGVHACMDEDRKLVIVDGDTSKHVASFDLPKYNTPHVKGWSPDSRWIVLEYYPQRADGPELWIVSRDGSVRGTLAKNNTFTRIAWRIEGVGSWPEPPD